MSALRALTPVFVVLALASCASAYDPVAYRYATDSKAEALWLMDKATDPAATHHEAIEALVLRTRRAVEYAAGQGPKNVYTAEQWVILLDPRRDLLGGFLRQWRAAPRGLSVVFVTEKRRQVADGFDAIIRLERAKIR